METKVVCPKCGAEMKIQENESLTIGISIGKDSGLGTVELPPRIKRTIQLKQ